MLKDHAGAIWVVMFFVLFCLFFLWVLPEEGVVLNADLPQTLRSPVVGQLEAYGALKLFILSSGWWWRRGRRGRREGEEAEKGE